MPDRLTTTSRSADEADAPRVAILIPTYDNRETLESVLRAAASHDLPLVVIDDASTDGCDAIIADLEHQGVVHRSFRVPRNLGKAGALRAGFELLRQTGFTHAITCDSDAQHDTDLIPVFAEAIRRSPGVYLLGCRFPLHPDQPRRNLIGRTSSNVAIRAHCGLAIGDSPCGFRGWPLELAATIPGLSGRYAWEEEMITRAAWAGWPVRSIDVPAIYHARDTRVSHYRFRRDWSEGIGIYLLLLGEALLPRLHRGSADRRPIRGSFLRRFDRLLSPGPLRGRRPEAATNRWFLLAAILLATLVATLAPASFATIAVIAWAGWRWHAGFAAIVIAALPSLDATGVSRSILEWIVLAGGASLLSGFLRPGRRAIAPTR
ncbi:MAG: hypothetical protein CMJ27_11405 [Phycisphaerae bacterium]|nr:hypothetical protein [Phycisphaerae bacterium]MAH66972.1 hypothetical protein [Phycisphaerae bacterium]OUX00470.1 MAG: hypothetical protein CBD91_06495 [Phycisphaeraceae bacterium TMED231]